MVNYSPEFPEGATVGDVFTDIHRRAHEIAGSVPVLISEESPTSEIDSLEEGYVYAHVERWIPPGYNMPAEETSVRVMAQDHAPYLFQVWSLRPEDESQPPIPGKVSAFAIDAVRAVSLERRKPDGHIEVVNDTQRSRGHHRPTTEVSTLPKPTRTRWNSTVAVITNRLLATRSLIEARQAYSSLTDTHDEVRRYLAQATVLGTLKLLGTPETD